MEVRKSFDFSQREMNLIRESLVCYLSANGNVGRSDVIDLIGRIKCFIDLIDSDIDSFKVLAPRRLPPAEKRKPQIFSI